MKVFLKDYNISMEITDIFRIMIIKLKEKYYKYKMEFVSWT